VQRPLAIARHLFNVLHHALRGSQTAECPRKSRFNHSRACCNNCDGNGKRSRTVSLFRVPKAIPRTVQCSITLIVPIAASAPDSSVRRYARKKKRPTKDALEMSATAIRRSRVVALGKTAFRRVHLACPFSCRDVRSSDWSSTGWDETI